MEPREFVFRRFQLHGHRRSIGCKVADVGPVEHFNRSLASIKSLRHETADKTPKTHVGSGHAPEVADVNQLDIIYTHDAFSIDVDELIVEHVLGEKHFALTSHERCQVELGRAHPRTMLVQLRDPMTGNKKVPPPEARDHADD